MKQIKNSDVGVVFTFMAIKLVVLYVSAGLYIYYTEISAKIGVLMILIGTVVYTIEMIFWLRLLSESRYSKFTKYDRREFLLTSIVLMFIIELIFLYIGGVK